MTAKPHISTPDLVRKTSRINWVISIFGLFFVFGGLVFIRSDFTIAATGTVSRALQVPVFSPRGGMVAEVFVEEGEAVQAGDPLLRMDGRELDLSLLEKRRMLGRVEQQLERAELQLASLEIQPGSLELITADERLKLLSEIAEIQSGIVTQYEELGNQRAVRSLDLQQQRIEYVRTRIQEMEARVLAGWKERGALEAEREQLAAQLRHARQEAALLREELALLERDQADLVVTAPLGGRVYNLEFDYANMRVEPGERLCEISDPESAFEVVALVGERNFDLIEPGMAVRMESQVFQSMLEGRILGVVSEVAPIAERLPDVTTSPLYEVEILVEETPFPLVLDSTLRVEFLVGRRSLWDVVISALSGRPDNPRAEDEPAADASEEEANHG